MNETNGWNITDRILVLKVISMIENSFASKVVIFASFGEDIKNHVNSFIFLRVDFVPLPRQ